MKTLNFLPYTTKGGKGTFRAVTQHEGRIVVIYADQAGLAYTTGLTLAPEKEGHLPVAYAADLTFVSANIADMLAMKMLGLM